MPLAIEARDLEKTYRNDVRALAGLSFQVEEGSVFALLGPNGAGKSTTVKILTTLSRADAGSAHVNGIDVAAKPDEVRRTIGVVAQRSGVDREATGRENLILQARLYGLGTRAAKARASELLESFALMDSADRTAGTYSGGMVRRLDVALGLMHRPRVLFLDEPTTGLDPEARAVMWTEIQRLAIDEGLTILLTTHYLEEADRLAATLAIVDRGAIVAEGTPEALKGELEGDAVHVEFHEEAAAAQARDAIGGIAGLREISTDGRELHARVASGATALPLILTRLDEVGVLVAAVTVARPSLDDVYLRYAGRSYSASGEKETTR